jgi:hypothetical protein
VPHSVSVRRTVGLAGLLLAMLLSLVATVGATTVAAAAAPCDGSSGTAFFGSAGAGAEFHEGDTWQGGTFTTIESDNHMIVRLETTGDLVGRFPMGFLNGDSATIDFDRNIRIVAVLFHDNDPNPGEAGWSFNGVAAPLTGNQTGVCVPWNEVTNQVNIDAGGDSGGVDFWFVEVGGEGCTPGYWKNHPAAWTATGYSTSQTLESVFDVPDSLGHDNTTLLQALSLGGGSGVKGGAQILLRAAVASLLNASNPGVSFDLTSSQVISQVNAALASGNRDTMLALATQLDTLNNQGCPLN